MPFFWSPAGKPKMKVALGHKVTVKHATGEVGGEVSALLDGSEGLRLLQLDPSTDAAELAEIDAEDVLELPPGEYLLVRVALHG